MEAELEGGLKETREIINSASKHSITCGIEVIPMHLILYLINFKYFIRDIPNPLIKFSENWTLVKKYIFDCFVDGIVLDRY